MLPNEISAPDRGITGSVTADGGNAGLISGLAVPLDALGSTDGLLLKPIEQPSADTPPEIPTEVVAPPVAEAAPPDQPPAVNRIYFSASGDAEVVMGNGQPAVAETPAPSPLATGTPAEAVPATTATPPESSEAPSLPTVATDESTSGAVESLTPEPVALSGPPTAEELARVMSASRAVTESVPSPPNTTGTSEPQPDLPASAPGDAMPDPDHKSDAAPVAIEGSENPAPQSPETPLSASTAAEPADAAPDAPPEPPSLEMRFSTIRHKARGRLYRKLSVVAALCVGIFLMGLTLFVGGSEQEIYADLLTALHTDGKSRIGLHTQDKFFVKGKQPLFGGELIEAIEGDTEIQFAEGSRLNLREGSKLQIDQLYPHPAVRLHEGEMWVMGNRHLEVRFEKARFDTRSVSALFQKADQKVTASSFRHPLFGELWAKDDTKHVFFAVPREKRVVFYENLIPPTIADLHFSKLKKEIHFSEAVKSDWVTKNLVEDNAVIAERIEKYRSGKKAGFFGESFVSHLRSPLMLFPAKKEKIAAEVLAGDQAEFLANLVGDSNALSMPPAEMNTEMLDTAMVISNMLPPTKPLLESAELLAAEAKQRELNGQPDRVIAHNLLSLFEDALSSNNPQMVEAILEKMSLRWTKQKKSPENRALLEMHREVVADLSRKYLGLITPEILKATARLDQIAITWDNKQMAVITTLEVAEKNLATADTFLEKSKLDMAKILLDVNDTLLKINPTTELISALESLTNRQGFLKEKYTVFKAYGWMSKEELFSLIAKRQNAEKIILYVQDEKRRLAMQDAPEAIEKPLSEVVRESFSTNKIQIISMIGADTKEAKSIDIIEARLPDGEIFSGEYLPDFEVIRNVKLDDGREIKNDVKLAQLMTTIEALRENRYYTSGEDLRQLRTNPIPELEKDPLEKMDTLDIEVTKLLAQANLAEKGFLVSLKDIAILSPKTVRLKNVSFEEIKGHSLEFSFNLDTRQVTEAVMLPENIAVKAASLDSLIEASGEALVEFEVNLERIGQVKWVLINAGCAVAENEVRFTPSGIHFENAIFHDWKLSGLADPEAQTFLMILKSGKPFLKNIPFERLKSALEKEWQKEEAVRASIEEQ